jgi:hypothetical protein
MTSIVQNYIRPSEVPQLGEKHTPMAVAHCTHSCTYLAGH